MTALTEGLLGEQGRMMHGSKTTAESWRWVNGLVLPSFIHSFIHQMHGD